MPERVHAAHVGSPDPELNTSPIVEETNEDFEVLGQEVPETGTCYFNDQLFREGEFVCSGDELLRCTQGAWLREGSCDPDNPD